MLTNLHRFALQESDLQVFPHPCLYAGDFNCQHVDRSYDTNSADGECLVGCANTNNLALLHNSKDDASFHSGRWNTSTNPDLAFVSIDPYSPLPDRHVLEKFPRSQHRPSLLLHPSLLVLYLNFCNTGFLYRHQHFGEKVDPTWPTK